MASLKPTIEFKRGNGTTHTLKIPRANYVAGGTLYFTAKPAPDNDNTDTAAVINKSFTDSSVTLDATYATYTLAFIPADIKPITFGADETKKIYQGEFTLVPATGVPVTFPGNNKYIQTIIYADIKVAA
jgi:hypothetical protein